MLFDGITLLAGSKIVNLTVNGGTSYPVSPAQGELFYRSDLLSLWVYNGSSWENLTRKLGAGVAEVPTGEIGVDVYATGGLMTTVDGTSSSTATGAQLGLTIVGTPGTYYSVTTNSHGRVTAGSVGGGTAGQVFTSTGAGTPPTFSSTPTLTGTNFSGIPNAALNNSSVTVGSTNISLGATSTTLAGLTSVTSTTFVGALTGNASTATALQTARTINGTSFDGTGNITITANTPNSLTINNGGAGAASGATFNGGSAVTISYNTVGAPSTTGTGASGTWGISITGSAVSSTTQALDTADTTIATTAFVDRLRGVPSSATSGTAVLADRGKMIVVTANLTIPNAIFAAGDTFSVFNNSAGTLTLVQGSGVTLRLSGTTTTGDRTIAAYGFVTVWFLSSSVAIASGNIT